ncbi:hypothetical protein [Cohnella sp. JJ-181]|uniref:hypothetical protein n=1 Tax=Cohnella rhizoplanae TaxID=2974897 RepID=UPI0022FF780C|nr:hypothetical protein [Cohnella sp. JJ-181]CAI6084766.1 hypothetical protein COHCIP112018_04448 [Cohnella sp. JJ-181]
MRIRTCRSATLAAALAMALLLLSSCAGGARYETIVIPDSEENGASSAPDQPFQASRIYRLPDGDAGLDRMLGWTGADTVAGLFAPPLRGNERDLQRLSGLGPPYERFEPLLGLDAELYVTGLSPDGRYLSLLAQAQEGISLQLAALPGGDKQTVALWQPGQAELLSRNVAWSDNGRYVSYLVAPAPDEPAAVGMFDTAAGRASQYPLAGLNTASAVAAVKLSDDGGSALIFSQGRLQVGTKQGSEYVVRYEHAAGSDQAAWLDDDRFVFLGTEGSLYEYDLRNGELAVLLRDVGIFQVSPDRRNIAYSQKDKNGDYSILAGKLQGNNVLYVRSVYQGFIPAQMYWSPEQNRLLVDGHKVSERATQAQPAPAADPDRTVPEGAQDRRPFIIEFKS